MAITEKDFRLDDKVAMVTGASGQLGTQIVAAFQSMGAKVCAVDIAPASKADEAVLAVEADIRDESAVEAAFNAAVERFGRVDILVNNAGASVFEPFEERSEESFDTVMDVNLKGTFFCTRQYVSQCRAQKLSTGSIINIGSIYGVVSPDPRIYTDCPRKNSEIYGATKAGIISMTRYFATHLAGDGIRVNCVSPGGILNPESPQGEDFQNNYGHRCPMNRMANEEEIVGAIVYLASNLSSYTNGQNLVIDGGFSAW